MIEPVRSTEKNLKIYLRTTVGCDRDLPLLVPFIEYYRNLGVTDFRFVVHSGDEGSSLQEARRRLVDQGLQPALIWITGSWNTGDNAQRHRRVVEDLPDEAWIVSADIDEFHEFPCKLPEFVACLEKQGVDVVKGRLVERVRADFRLKPYQVQKNLFAQFPVQTTFGIGNPGKVVLHRKWIRTTPGHHSYEGDANHSVTEYCHVLKVMHFKWYEGVLKKYTDPSLMAHHSSDWEFVEYAQFIRRNFYGLGRVSNVVIHHAFFPRSARAFIFRVRKKIEAVINQMKVG